jgi:NAD(P)H-flavin reductase
MLFKKYRSNIVTVENPLEGIYTVEFTPDREKYRYKPGQFLHLAIDPGYDGVGQWPDSRCFSIQSSPEESTVRITFAVKGKFTSQMRDVLSPEKKVWLKLPYGELFTQEHSKENTVFIAGGTGITPYLSLFNHDSFQQYINPHIYLGFRSKAHNIYTNELDHLKNSSQTLTYYYEDADGVVAIESIVSKHGSNSCYFISGPPRMIKTFKSTLLEKNVPPSNILTDDWG